MTYIFTSNTFKPMTHLYIENYFVNSNIPKTALCSGLSLIGGAGGCSSSESSGDEHWVFTAPAAI